MTRAINPEVQQFDIVILGAGIVGSLLANALQAYPISIAMIDAKPKLDHQEPTKDQRAIALSRSSLNVLQTLGFDLQVKIAGVSIHQVHVCQQDALGQVVIDRHDEDVTSLGHVVNITQLQWLLDQRVGEQVKRYDGYCVTEIDQMQQGCAQLTAINETDKKALNIQAKLVIAADGAHSTARHLLSAEAIDKDYQQTAIVSTISTKRCQQNIAYERFTKQGPIALLPIADKQFSLIWCASSDRAQQLLALEDADFIRALQVAFGYRIGRLVNTSRRQSFPLTAIDMPLKLMGNVLFFGNAAHTLHPIAGQGFNLCIRETAVLSEYIANALEQNNGLKDMTFLKPYLDQISRDCQQTTRAVDNLVTTFSNAYCGWPFMRSLGLQFVQRHQTVKSNLTQKMMGYRMPSSRLSRGLPLCK